VPRTRYKWFRSCGLFVGSGVVQAGCKAAILPGWLARRGWVTAHMPALLSACLAVRTKTRGSFSGFGMAEVLNGDSNREDGEPGGHCEPARHIEGLDVAGHE
jgi:hypothetical protein